MSDLNVSVVVKAIDKMSGPLQRLTGEQRRFGQSIADQQSQLDRVTAATERLAEAREKMNAAAKTSAKFAVAGAAAAGVAYGTKSLVDSVMEPVKALEKARGDLASLGMDQAGQNVVIEQARAASRKIAGVTADSFVRAAYDIKSGISSLSAEGVAEMTRAAALTAKATKATPEAMTSLFATGYGVFKRQFSNLSDDAFGGMFSASIAKSVQDFKTTGSEMQQAIQSAGSGATNLGMSLADQLSILGMLQTTMEDGEAGTSLKSFSENAAKAQAGFDKLGNGVRVLTEDGQLRDMADILVDLKDAYGDTLDAMEAREIQDAFGSSEAMKLINNLWGMDAAFRAQSKSIKAAGEAGLSYTQGMVNAAQDNFADRWLLMTQRIGDLKETLGRALLPTIEAVIARIGPVVSAMADWIKENQGLASTIGVAVVAIGGIAAILSPILLTVSSLIGSIAMAKFAFAAFSLGAIKIIPAIQGIIGVVNVLKLALLSNPITAVALALATAAALIIANWDEVQAFFMGLWEPIKPIWDAFVGWIGKVWEAISAPIRAVSAFLGGGSFGMAADLTAQPAFQTAAETSGFGGGAILDAPPVTGVQQGRSVSSASTLNATFNITANSRDDGKAIADEAERAVRRAFRDMTDNERGALYDND
jgi:TP901 family phage tail tape measure protein